MVVPGGKSDNSLQRQKNGASRNGMIPQSAVGGPDAKAPKSQSLIDSPVRRTDKALAARTKILKS
jgi:hypothetical protein